MLLTEMLFKIRLKILSDKKITNYNKSKPQQQQKKPTNNDEDCQLCCYSHVAHSN